MHEIAKVTLENEMDLILAHKRSMKLAEITGLSLSAQTTFATAVSEVARNTIESGKSGCLVLNVESEHREKFIVACLKDEHADAISRKGLENAKKLVNRYHVSTKGGETSIELFYYISPSFIIDIKKLDEWRSFFRNEPPISAYDELKRKNEQLQDLSEKVVKSEAEYKTLTNSLPLIIFSIDEAGGLLYANEWLQKYTGETIERLNRNKWKNVLHPDDYEAFVALLKNDGTQKSTATKRLCRLKNNVTGDFLWHQLSITPFTNDSGMVLYRTGYFVDIHAQKLVEETLKDNIELKRTQEQLKEYQRTQEKFIEELNRSNLELQQFAFVASHDLQEPVRKLLYYSDYLLSVSSQSIDPKGLEYLMRTQRAAERMRSLIQDLLIFSQINKEELKFNQVNLQEIANDVYQDFEMAIEECSATLTYDALPIINADKRMMQQLFANILSNALKYSKAGQAPQIKISFKKNQQNIELAFKDNGIGFQQKYLPQMFALFQRLHTKDKYRGTGLGLAICKKIVDIHHGRIWAEGEEGEGATFYVSLPINSVSN